MANKESISNDEFADAIIASRLPRKSMRAFFEAITSPGPKEKHVGWIRVCDYIRKSRNMSQTNKLWRKKAHQLFMEHLVAIEHLVWTKIMCQPVDPDDTEDVYATLINAVNNVSDAISEISIDTVSK